MPDARVLLAISLAALLGLAGCATRPVNPPLERVDHTGGYRYTARTYLARDHDNLIVLAFSGGGTRAAAFSYGVLEELRRLEVVGPKGNRGRVLGEVAVITGVSGGSFTALAYGLYGDKLFDQYEQRFLKRNVEGELIGRLFNPAYWGPLSSTGWGRSELAADLYDEILFDGATFADLQRGPGPMIVATATDLSTGVALLFHAADVRHPLLGPLRRAIVPRGGLVVGGARRAVPGDVQQLRRNLRLPRAAVADADRQSRRPAAPRGARDAPARRIAHLREREGAPVHPPRRRRRRRQSRDARRPRRDGRDRGAAARRPADDTRQHQADCGDRRQLAVVAKDGLGQSGRRAGLLRRADAGDGRADRSLFLRGDRAAARQGGPLEDAASHSGLRACSRTRRARRWPK